LARSKPNTRRPQSRSSTAPRSARPKQVAASKPVGAAEFEAALARLDVKAPFALAVSGGADSLALMLLAAAWCKKHKQPPPLALTVDHGLRPEAADEAAQVGAWARAYDIAHETLVWRSRKRAAGNIQALAREARYELIGARMRGAGLHVLLTGHTLDDQAETFLLRLARGSGLHGLSGMADVAPFPLARYRDLKIARPLLGFAHDRLTATLAARGQRWLTDPSNANDRFARVKVRNAADALKAAGLTNERIAAAAAQLARARQAIDAAVAALIAAAVDVAPWGYALVDVERLAAAPREVALRTLARLIEVVGGSAYPPRFEQTEAALDWLVARAAPAGRTLGGCRIARRDGQVLVTREAAALAKEAPDLLIEPGGAGLWDARFWVAVPQSARAAVEVRPLGVAGLKAAGSGACLPPVEPRRIAAALPALWRENRLVAAPLIGFAGDEPAISARFVGFAGT
jgi:tRNA(Ile)-lysidine synthase